MRSTAGEILKRHFEKLKRQNKKFSLRSLASKLEISHSFLSRLLKDQALIPIALLDPLIEFLKIDPLESENLKRIVVERRAGLKSGDVIYAASTPASDPKDFINLPEKQLHIMRKWWNFAIMDLLTCQLSLRFTPEVIAAMLPIPTEEIMNSLTELTNIGLIKQQNDGAYVKTEAKIRFPTRGPNPHTREFYRQGLQLAKEELNRTSEQDFSNRLILGFSCSANRKNIPLAKQKLAAALRECALLLSEGVCDDVFFVQGQMFSVLKKKTTE